MLWGGWGEVWDSCLWCCGGWGCVTAIHGTEQAGLQTGFALIQLCVPSVPRHPPLQPIHLLHDILYNQDLGKAIKRDFLSGSERMLIDVWNTIILLGSLAFFCSWLLLIKQLYFLGLLCPFTRSFLPRSRRCLKKAVCLCIPNISQGRGKKNGRGSEGKNQSSCLVCGSFAECCFWVGALHLDSSSCQLKRKLLFCLLKRQQVNV